MDNAFGWVPFAAAILVIWRFTEINPHQSRRSRAVYLLGPTVTTFVIASIALHNLQAGLLAGVFGLMTSGILYLFYNVRHR